MLRSAILGGLLPGDDFPSTSLRMVSLLNSQVFPCPVAKRSFCYWGLVVASRKEMGMWRIGLKNGH